MAMFYRSALTKALSGDLDAVGTCSAYLVTSGYTPDHAHSALSDVPSGTRVANTTFTATVDEGQVQASTITFTAATGDPCVGLVILSPGGDLIAYLNDFGSGAGNTTITPNGSNIAFTVSSSWVARLLTS